MRWFVSRHPGAVEWLAGQGVQVDRLVEHLDVREVEAGDWVLGTLPVSLVAQVCARGAFYLHLDVRLPAHARGSELSVAQLQQFGARLGAYHVLELSLELP